MAVQMSEPMKRSNLGFALTLPVFFMVMFPLCYVTALHMPAPHHIPVAVAGPGAAAFTAKAGPALAGKVDLIPVGSPGQAHHLLMDQTVKAAYVPGGSGHASQLSVAGADGRLMSQLLPGIFRPVADHNGGSLKVHDVAPLAPGDGNGIGLMFFMLICVLVGFMAANIIGNAAYFLRMRHRIVISAGLAVLAPLVLYLFMGVWLRIIVGTPGQIVAALVTAAVASFTTGLLTHTGVVFLGKWALFPAMLLFVFLNISSSNSAYTAEIVPPFFSWISHWHLGAAMVDITRSVLYLHGDGLTRPLTVMAIWLASAAAIGAALAYRRHKAKTTESTNTAGQQHTSDNGQAQHAAATGAGPGSPALHGQVHNPHGTPVTDATVTVVDPAGSLIGQATADNNGRFRIENPKNDPE